VSPPKLHPFWWLVPPTCYERFVNGGFETGDLTGWRVGACAADGYDVGWEYKHTGLYGLALFYLGCIAQHDFTVKPYTNYIQKFEYWFRAALGNGVTTNTYVYYTDRTWTFYTHNSGPTTNWRRVNLLPSLANNKYIDYIQVKFAAYTGPGDDIYLDDFTLIECVP